jgi:hypothetical protein
MACLTGWWLREKLVRFPHPQWEGIHWFWMIPAYALASYVCADTNPFAYIAVSGLAALPLIICLALSLKRKRFGACIHLTCVFATCTLIVSSTPNVLTLRYEKRCYIPFAREVLRHTGPGPLFLYQPRDTLRGTIPFIAGRTVREIDTVARLETTLASPAKCCIVMRTRVYESISGDPSFENTLFPVTNGPLQSDPDYILLSNRAD